MNYFLFLHPLLIKASGWEAALVNYIGWWSLPIAAAGFVGLLIVIYRFVTMSSRARVWRERLASNYEVEITATGKLTLTLEAARGTARFPGTELNYELIRLRDNQQIYMWDTMVAGLTRKSWTHVTFPVRGLQIEEPGKYLLGVSGFSPQIDYSGYSLIVERPMIVKMLLHILGINLTAVTFVSGLIFALVFSGTMK